MYIQGLYIYYVIPKQAYVEHLILTQQKLFITQYITRQSLASQWVDSQLVDTQLLNCQLVASQLVESCLVIRSPGCQEPHQRHPYPPSPGWILGRQGFLMHLLEVNDDI